MKLPIAVTYRGSEPERIAEFGKTANATAQMVITPSRRTADDLNAIGGVPREKLRVVGLGVRPAPDVDESAVAQLRAELLGETATQLVVVVARLARQKGIDILIEAVRRIA